MANTIQRRKLTPPQIAAQYGINADKVIRWIATGELRAINVATLPDGRPRWMVDVDDLAAFEQRRSAVPQAPKPTRRKRQAVGAIEFYS